MEIKRYGEKIRITEFPIEYWLLPYSSSPGSYALRATNQLTHQTIYDAPPQILDADGHPQGGWADPLYDLGWSQHEILQGYRDAWKKDLGIKDMGRGEFTAIRTLLGYGVDDTARLLGVNPRTIRRWETGDNFLPAGVQREMRFMWQGFISAVERLAGGKGIVDKYLSEEEYLDGGREYAKTMTGLDLDYPRWKAITRAAYLLANMG